MNGQERIPPGEVVKRLMRRRYLARQNGKDECLFLNLGGPQSKLNKGKRFNGAMLLNPCRDFVFGVCPKTMLQFRKLVMEQRGEKEWVRKTGVPGPNSYRVTVWFVESDTGEVTKVRVVCKREPNWIWLEGYPAYLPCDIDGYDWGAVEDFLVKYWKDCRAKGLCFESSSTECTKAEAAISADRPRN